jgi:hypothetical protein
MARAVEIIRDLHDMKPRTTTDASALRKAASLAKDAAVRDALLAQAAEESGSGDDPQLIGDALELLRELCEIPGMGKSAVNNIVVAATSIAQKSNYSALGKGKKTTTETEEE